MKGSEFDEGTGAILSVLNKCVSIDVKCKYSLYNVDEICDMARLYVFNDKYRTFL